MANEEEIKPWWPDLESLLPDDAPAKPEELKAGWRENVVAYTKLGMARVGKDGRLIGAVPFGYRLACPPPPVCPCCGEALLHPRQRLAEVPEEQEALRMMGEWRAAGWTYRAIAAELERLGVKTKTGREAWGPNVVMFVLRRAARVRATQAEAE